MSKRMTRISRMLMRTFFGALIACGSMIFSTDISLAQDGGYSVFESAEESNDAPIVVSPKEAFTNPAATLPKAQFGQLKNTHSSQSPQLNGSKPIGPYANDGRNMFKQEPRADATNSRKLQPFSSNSLRSENRLQSEQTASTLQAPPIVVGDFQESARRLSSPAPKASDLAASTEADIAQVAYQEGGFTPMNRPQPDNAASQFGQQPATNQFAQQPTPSTGRFGNGSSTGQQQPLSPRTLQPRQQLRSPAPQPRQDMLRGFSSSSQQPRVDPSGLGNPQNSQGPAARTATLPQQLNRSQQRATATPAAKTGTKAAKELLSGWAEKEDSQLKLPGKRMTLRSFLAQPINGSRKDAINQYWLTFNDMANHKIAVEQSQWLTSITNVPQRADQAVLKAAQQAAENSVLHTEIQLAKSQSMLHDFLPGFRYKNGKNIPVLPADIPWVGNLNTRYEEYRNRGMVPDKFNGIDEFLPKSRQLIANRADAVTAASQAAEQAKSALMSGQTPVSNVLEAARIKTKNQHDLLSTVNDYNRAITDYVLTVRQDIYQPDRLSSVLIGRNTVQSSMAKKEKSQEDTNSSNGASSTPALRQASTEKEKLQGESAYQGSVIKDAPKQNDESGLGESLLSDNTGQDSRSQSPFANASTTRQTQPATKRFDFGPTADSAKQANFDPSKVQEELPIQKAKQVNGSSGYEDNVARGGAGSPFRSASKAGAPAQPWGNRNGTGDQQNQSAAVRAVEQRAPLQKTNTQPSPRFDQGTGGGISRPQTPNRSILPPNSSVPATGSPPTTNPTTNPFTTQGSSGAMRRPTGDRISSRLGGGTFGGSSTGQQPSAPVQSPFTGFGESTKR